MRLGLEFPRTHTYGHVCGGVYTENQLSTHSEHRQHKLRTLELILNKVGERACIPVMLLVLVSVSSGVKRHLDDSSNSIIENISLEWLRISEV